MIGNQIKYEPAWILSATTKKDLQKLRAEEAIISVTGGMQKNQMRSIQKMQTRAIRERAEQTWTAENSSMLATD